MLEVFVALVIGISDGDTLTVLRENQPVKVRLAEIDAPEKRQPFGERSKQSLANMCFQVRAEIKPQVIDKYGRTVARVRCGSYDANAQQVQRGFAWVYDKYVTDHTLYKLQDEARANSRGLWSERTPVPPWDFRRR